MIKIPAVIVCNHCELYSNPLTGLDIYTWSIPYTRTLARKDDVQLCINCLELLKTWLNIHS